MPITYKEIAVISRQHGDDGSQKYRDTYPAHFHAGCGDTDDLCKLILESRGPQDVLNSFDCAGLTLLALTVYYSMTSFIHPGKLEAIIALLEWGADPYLPCREPLAGVTPLYIASARKAPFLIRLLIWYGPENYATLIHKDAIIMARMERYYKQQPEVRAIIDETYAVTCNVKQFTTDAVHAIERDELISAGNLYYAAAHEFLGQQNIELHLPYIELYECYRKVLVAFYGIKHEEFLLKALSCYEAFAAKIGTASNEHAEVMRQALKHSDYENVLQTILQRIELLNHDKDSEEQAARLAQLLRLKRPEIWGQVALRSAYYADKLAKLYKLLEPASFTKSYTPPEAKTEHLAEDATSPTTSEDSEAEATVEVQYEGDEATENAPLLRGNLSLTHSTLHKRPIRKDVRPSPRKELHPRT